MEDIEDQKELDLTEKIEKFIQDLKHSNIQGSYLVAYNTLNLLRQLIEETDWKTTAELMEAIKENGRRMHEAQPVETAIANMVRRVLKIIREECARSVKGQSTEAEQEDSLQKLLLAEGGAADVRTKQNLPDINAAEVIAVINELITELEASCENIAAQALEHIHANEIILTAGKSRTVEAFLKKAAKKRKFHVIVVEGAPLYHGHELSMSLAKDGIETTLITDTAVFAMMSRVNKVIIGTHTVTANGGLKAFSGSHTVALAAKFYSVPVIVCAAMFKLSPQYVTSSDQESFNKYLNPQGVLPHVDGDILSKVQVYNSAFNFVPPELVTLFISNIGGNAPFYTYRLLSELYSTEDQELFSTEHQDIQA